MNRELQVAAWNVRGFGDPHRVSTVKSWIRRLYPTTDIICLQELQANSSLVELHLRNLIPDGTVVLDATEEGRTGSAIVVAPNVQVLDKGQKGDGTFAWGILTCWNFLMTHWAAVVFFTEQKQDCGGMW
jgi:exonuclease III